MTRAVLDTNLYVDWLNRGATLYTRDAADLEAIRAVRSFALEVLVP